MRYGTQALLISGLLSMSALGGCQERKPKTLEPDKVKTLQVTGVGEIEIMPDQFVLSGAVIKQNEELTDAMNAVADVINKVQADIPVLSGMKGSDFNFASVNTTGVKDPECLLFNQEAERTNSSLRETEKRISKKICKDAVQQASVTFTFTGSPVDRAGSAVSALAEAGAVRVRLNGYKISNQEEIELQAGEKAIANARDKAERLAAAGGTTIKGVKNLNTYVPTYNQQAASAPRVNTHGAGESERILKEDSEQKSVTAMNLKPGPQTISASVTLEFIYE